MYTRAWELGMSNSNIASSHTFIEIGDTGCPTKYKGSKTQCNLVLTFCPGLQ